MSTDAALLPILVPLVISLFTFYMAQKRADSTEARAAAKDVVDQYANRLAEQSTRLKEIGDELRDVRGRLDRCELARESLLVENVRLMRLALHLDEAQA